VCARARHRERERERESERAGAGLPKQRVIGLYAGISAPRRAAPRLRPRDDIRTGRVPRMAGVVRELALSATRSRIPGVNAPRRVRLGWVARRGAARPL
jgi:hypothetical protein